MSEIVPASPSVPPGWYVDASGRQRWWDGTAWGVFAPQASAPPTVFVRPLKETGIAYLFAILLGAFGAHHFYLGNVGAAIGFIALWWIGWFTTIFLVGFVLLFAAAVWWIVDLFLIPTYVRGANLRAAR